MMTKIPGLRWKIGVIGFMITMTSVESPLGAQTRFEFPDSKVDVTHFRYVENCMSASQRVQDSLNVVNPADPDTISLLGRDWAQPIPAAVLKVTNQCLEHFTPEQIPAPFAQMAQKAFLFAGRDADAAALVRLRVNPLTDSTERAFVLDSFARNYMNSSPRRVAAAHAIADEVINTYSAYYRGLRRAGLCGVMTRAAAEMRDEPSLLKYGQVGLDAIADADPEELDGPYGWIIALVVREMNQAVYRKQILDSLRVSTKAFVAVQKALFKKVMGERADPSPVGMETAPLTGKFWFPASAASETYPRKGKISVVQFPSADPDFFFKHVNVVVRRLASRYPDADLVFSGKTRGYFGPLSQREAQLESEEQSRFYQQFRKNTKAVLGIAVSEIVELPPPDNRRVHLTPKNYENYPKSEDERHVFIVDEDGILIERQFVDHMSPEIWLDDLMAVLMERHKVRQQ